jgi:DNA-binding MurR/RpiR family transcriptional regulator
MAAAGDDLLERIGEARPRLSRTMVRVAAFLEEEYLRAAFLSTRELAAATGVSLATIVRFPRELGYADFGELREAIQARVRVDLDAIAHFRSVSSSDPGIEGQLRRVIDTDIESLTLLSREVDAAQIGAVVDALRDAPRVLVAGFRASAALAEYLGYPLRKLLSDVRTATAADSTLYDLIATSAPGSVLVAIATARYPADLVEVARFASSRGLVVVAITDSRVSPLVGIAATALVARQTRFDFVGSIAAGAALATCIVAELGVRLGAAGVERVRLLEEAAAASAAYVGPESGPRAF